MRTATLLPLHCSSSNRLLMSRVLRMLPARARLQVRLAERYERHWGRTADASLCVTRAMQLELQRHWRVPASVFYDRPPDFFRPASLQARRRRRCCCFCCCVGSWRGRKHALFLSFLHFERHCHRCLLSTCPRACRSGMSSCASCSQRWRSRCTRTTLPPSCAASWRHVRRCAQRRARTAAAGAAVAAAL